MTPLMLNIASGRTIVFMMSERGAVIIMGHE